MENIVAEPKWRRTTHGVVTMVNYVMEAKLASKVGAVRMMPITNVQTKGVEIINQVKCQKTVFVYRNQKISFTAL